jgi:hypothetical protein
MPAEVQESIDKAEENLDNSIKDIATEQEELKQRVSLLEQMLGINGKVAPEVVETDIVLPEAEIDGLFFNEHSVRAVFEKGNDGWYYSRDILFLSARNAVDSNSRDILQRYLDDAGGDREIRAQIADIFDTPPTAIEIALPQKPQGIKKYHGVDCWYWLRPRYSDSAANFCIVSKHGYTLNDAASAVGGCAPAFRIKGDKRG